MNTIAVLFLIMALGYLLGRITVKGVNLGSSGIILVALVFGHWGVTLPKEIQNLGLICFVTAVGYIAGPVFFRNFQKKAFAYIGIGFLIIFTGALVCIAAILLFDIPAASAPASCAAPSPAHRVWRLRWKPAVTPLPLWGTALPIPLAFWA